MYGKPWNPKRPYGEVKGDERFHFDQDGQLYNALKMPVDGNGNLMPLPEVAAKVEEEAPPPAPVAEDPADDIPADELPFDIMAWAQGEPTLAKTPWDKIKAETVRLIGDASGITGKDSARKAVLAHFGL